MKAKTIQSVAAVIMGLILVFVTIKMYQRDIAVNLKDTTRVEGVVTRAFDTTDTYEADLLDKKRIFAFEINSVPQTLGVSERATDYDKIRAALKPGTPITMYYRPNQSSLNMDIYQIEKGSEVIMDYENNEKSSWFVLVMIGLLAIFLLVRGIAQLLKKEPRTAQG